MKRLFDISLSLVTLAVLWPVFLVIAVLIKLTSRGPVFFRQARVGKDLREFEFLKFRSMVVDAPKLGAHWTSKDDPRITRVGRFLRRTSLDELPQLWNVLKGDMSLVGPRPNMPIQEKDYDPAAWQQRHQVRPGITGLAQVMGRSNLTTVEQARYDLDYVKKSGLFYDLALLWRTFWMVIFSRNTN